MAVRDTKALVWRSRGVEVFRDSVLPGKDAVDYVERKSHSTNDGSDELDPRERKTLLTIIVALATDCKLSLDEPYATAETVRAGLQGIGLSRVPSTNAIADKMKAAKQMLESH